MTPTTRSKTESIAASSSSTDRPNHNARLRENASGAKSSRKISSRSTTYDEPPRFVIDLSLPPEQRYLEVCAAYKDKMRTLTPLFEEVMVKVSNHISMTWITRLTSVLLRRVYDEEENRELQGISKAAGIEMYLLVCFNVLLDLFMGCSSGGAAVRDGRTGGSKMVHFRTLDWGMPSLRQVVIQLNFKTRPDGPIMASSITYAGYVGVLTGVRKDFSLSLNFRPNRHDRGRWLSDVRYYWHLVMVLFGRQRSISSHLRQCLLPSRKTDSEGKSSWNFVSYVDIVERFGGGDLPDKTLTTTSCYLCFCSGTETTILEKDRTSATVRKDKDIIVITNNDVSMEDDRPAATQENNFFAAALKDIVEESKDRRECAETNYRLMRHEKMREADPNMHVHEVMEVRDIISLIKRYPTLNEMTHYACVLDPKEGIVRWCRRWLQPITEKWIREHPSYE